ETTADIGGTLDMTVPVFVGITDVDDGQRLARLDPPLDLFGTLLGHDLPCLGNHLLERLHWVDVTSIPVRRKSRVREPDWRFARSVGGFCVSGILRRGEVIDQNDRR